MKRHIDNFNNFVSKDTLTKKFNFIVGREYSFGELPAKIKKDIEIQFDEYSELQPDDYRYVAKLLKPEEIEEYLHNQFGEYDVLETLDSPYMKKLISDIKKNGLDYPSVGVEGNHRALACWFLKRDLPYLEMIEID